MKKTALTLVVLVVLGMSFLVGSALQIGSTATDISYVPTTIYGDPGTAEGLEVYTQTTLDHTMFWDTTLSLGDIPTWDTQFRYTLRQEYVESSVEPWCGLYSFTDFSMSSSGTVDVSEDSYLEPYAWVLQELAQEAPANSRGYTKTIPLSQVMDVFPLYWESNSSSALWAEYTREMDGLFAKELSQRFHISTLGYTVTLAIDTNEQKEVTGVSVRVDNGPIIYASAIETGDAVYVGFGVTDVQGNPQREGCAPFGLYRIPILWSQDAPTMDLEHMELVFPYDGTISSLNFMENSSKLFLTGTDFDGTWEGIWLNMDTMELAQTMPFDSAYGWHYLFVEDDHVIYLTQMGDDATTVPWEATVWAKGEDGLYHTVIQADITQAQLWRMSSLSAYYDARGGRLLLATYADGTSDPSLRVAVCDATSLTYAATFQHSQSQEYRFYAQGNIEITYNYLIGSTNSQPSLGTKDVSQ